MFSEAEVRLRSRDYSLDLSRFLCQDKKEMGIGITTMAPAR
jgi:hypothetical protein